MYPESLKTLAEFGTGLAWADCPLECEAPMISGIDSSNTQLFTPPAPTAKGSAEKEFDAADAAKQKAEANAEARKQQMQTIREKGFRKWVGEKQAEKLKEELRKKIMASMGLTEDDIAKMAPAIQQILEQKIQEAVEQEMQKELQKQQAEKESKAAGEAQKASAQKDGEQIRAAKQTVLAAQEEAGQIQPGQEKQDGKKCPVIPALAWPGLAPGVLF
jgi:hypothetical protein